MKTGSKSSGREIWFAHHFEDSVRTKVYYGGRREDGA